MLKRGPVVVPHFAHRARERCVWSAGETATHLAAKDAVVKALTSRGLDAAVEVPVLSGAGDRRADILVREPASGASVAIEIQHSAIAIDAIAARTRAYAAAGVAVLWVPTLDLTRIGARPVAGGRLRVTTRYAAPDWQRWAAAYHGGALWFWAGGALWRGWLDEGWMPPSHRDTRPSSSETDGWRPSARFASLMLEGPFAPGDIRIALARHPARPHERYDLPAGPAALLLAPGERHSPPPPMRIVWAQARGRFAPRLRLRSRAEPPLPARADAPMVGAKVLA